MQFQSYPRHPSAQHNCPLAIEAVHIVLFIWRQFGCTNCYIHNPLQGSHRPAHSTPCIVPKQLFSDATNQLAYPGKHYDYSNKHGLAPLVILLWVSEQRQAQVSGASIHEVSHYKTYQSNHLHNSTTDWFSRPFNRLWCTFGQQQDKF